MLYVDSSQFEEVEYLLNQSIQGNHLLFNNEQIKKVFSIPLAHEEIIVEHLEGIKDFFQQLLSQPSIQEKRKFVEALPTHIQDLLIMTYFNILDNNLDLKQKYLQ